MKRDNPTRRKRASAAAIALLMLTLGPSHARAADTDSDGMDDDWEVTHFGDLSRDGTGDYDADGITDLDEYTYDLDPTVNDAYEDADGDRYPNVFEIEAGSDPTDGGDLPAPMYVVDVNGGGDYTTIDGAIGAATTSNGDYQIIEIDPGTYTGASNCTTNVYSSKPFLLFVGTGGAVATIIDCGGMHAAWGIYGGVVLASLTIRNATEHAIQVNTEEEVRLVDLLVHDNAGTSQKAGGVHIPNAGDVHVVGSTFINNTGNGRIRSMSRSPIST